MAIATALPYDEDHERRLRALGLSTEIIHNGLRRGAERAANRSSFALKTAAGMDIYQDGMEDFSRLLAAGGWQLIEVEGQPRLLHPDAAMSFTISSGIDVGSMDLRKGPRTRRKGKATRASLVPQPPHPSLFEGEEAADAAELVARATVAPFYFLLCERAPQGGGVYIELAQPASPMTAGGSVNQWGDRIRVGFLPLEGDLSVFDQPEDEGPDEFNVPVEPR
jgi:hypothetical protein